ncbi:hypothetical protein Scep_019666 [Stephania cephalantha]|uniref:Uncharacterized protein n=1 Tax=Stephania cephalantha TaxID=152367 RepID=A0AAP0NLL0_9MAGN
MAFNGGLQSKIQVNLSRRRASSKSRRLVHGCCLVGDRSVRQRATALLLHAVPRAPAAVVAAASTAAGAVAAAPLSPPRRCRRRCCCRAAAETPFLLAGVPYLLLAGVLCDSRATSWSWNRRPRHRLAADGAALLVAVPTAAATGELLRVAPRCWFAPPCRSRCHSSATSPAHRSPPWLAAALAARALASPANHRLRPRRYEPLPVCRSSTALLSLSLSLSLSLCCFSLSFRFFLMKKSNVSSRFARSGTRGTSKTYLFKCFP